MSPWNDDTVAMATRMWAEGKSASEIAKAIYRAYRISISRNGVIGKLHRLGLGGRGTPSRQMKRPPLRLAHPKPRVLRDDGQGGEDHQADQLDREIMTCIADGCALPDIAEAYPERGLEQVEALAKEIAA